MLHGVQLEDANSNMIKGPVTWQPAQRGSAKLQH